MYEHPTWPNPVQEGIKLGPHPRGKTPVTSPCNKPRPRGFMLLKRGLELPRWPERNPHSTQEHPLNSTLGHLLNSTLGYKLMEPSLMADSPIKVGNGI